MSTLSTLSVSTTASSDAMDSDYEDTRESFTGHKQSKADNWRSFSAVTRRPSKAPACLSVGDQVFVRMNSGNYRRGEVKAAENLRCSVQLQGLENIVECDTKDPTSVILKVPPAPSELKKGARVVFWKEAKIYYPGTLQKLKKDSFTGLKNWRIVGDNDATYIVRPEHIVLIPKSDKNVLPGIGCSVYAKSPEDPTKYEKAIVVEKTYEAITVKTLLSGIEVQFEIDDTDAVIYNEEPNFADIRCGNKVIASKGGSRGISGKFTMTPGKIMDIDFSSRKFKVSFDDGKTKLLTVEQLRLVSKSR